MGMEKKNPYVTTIGFNRKDPSHVQVARILNEMGRGKAQYIVNAVLSYQNKGIERETTLNSAEIRQIVKEVVKDYMQKNKNMEGMGEASAQIEKKASQNVFESLGRQDYSNILESIDMFKLK